MSEYYAVVRSTDHLAHYGVVGMKWGVRRALTSGNERALNRHFNRAARKLKKLQKIGLNPKKSAAKAAAYGAAAAATGTIAIGGTGAASAYLRNKAKKLAPKIIDAELREPGIESYKEGTALRSATAKELNKKYTDLNDRANSIDAWGNTKKKIPASKTPVRDNKGVWKLEDVPEKEVGLTRNQKLRLGAGSVALGLGAMSALHAYRAKNAKKYREKAVAFKNAMDDTFAGTKYEGMYVKQPRKKKRRIHSG